MSRRLIVVLLSIVAVMALGGFFAFGYVTASPARSYATYAAPTFAPEVTDEQRIWALQDDLGNAAAEMAQLQEMATKLQFGKMKAMGNHLQEVADDLEPRLAEIENEKTKAILASGISGLRTVGEGSAELDPNKSLQGVDQVLKSFDDLRELNL